MNYENKEIIKKVINKEKGKLQIEYHDFRNDSYKEFGNIKIKNMPGKMGYLIYLRNYKSEKDDLFINDLFTLKEMNKKDLEKILKINESIANEFGCSSITVDVENEKIKKFYESKGYNFAIGHIGTKKIK